ncbi:MAG: nuclear transport factor 2 family protein [Ignavibacteriales bacterium]
MKIQRFLSVIFSVLFLTVAIKAGTPASGEDEVKQTVQNYTKSIDTKDVAALQQVLAPTANFTAVNRINNNFTQTTASDFINSVKSGKVGGWERTLTINSVDMNDNVAMAKIELTDARLKQVEYVTLVNMAGNWKIVNSTYSVEKKK